MSLSLMRATCCRNDLCSPQRAMLRHVPITNDFGRLVSCLLSKGRADAFLLVPSIAAHDPKPKLRPLMAR